MIKLGIIGCGNIASFHLPVMRKAGFKINALSGRPGGFETVKNFGKENNVNSCYENSFELIKSNCWDALLITCPVKNTIEYIEAAAKFNKPILSEKPVAEDYKILKPFIKYKNIRVAFNRRFYNNVAEAKKFIKRNGVCLIKVSIPESEGKEKYQFPKRLPQNSYTNSTHIFDLINFLAGLVSWDFVSKIKKNNKFTSISAIGKSTEKHTIMLDNTYNSSENFSINIISSRKRFHLSPIEIGRYYEGMKINEPTKQVPIRTYMPHMKKEFIENKNSLYKPGFLEQSMDFMRFCKGKGSISADINDTYKALKLVQSLVDF
tara:strand:+ start:446 stop:1402 length:957 start_codon:yes stop_codon:yes gene_type:complete